jgi:hypothetical protein
MVNGTITYSITMISVQNLRKIRKVVGKILVLVPNGGTPVKISSQHSGE